jgi:hypothetical protein
VRTIHNPVPRYNVAQSTDCSLSLFSIKGDSTSRGVPRHLTAEEWDATMLYVFTNLTEVDDYIRKFIDEEWTSRGVPTRQQQENILQNGAGRDHPNFVSWFCKKVISLSRTLFKLKKMVTSNLITTSNKKMTMSLAMHILSDQIRKSTLLCLL